MGLINWSADLEELVKIDKICSRAMTRQLKRKRIDLSMDLDATHSNGCPLDFDKLLKAKDFDFYHDIYGIIKNLDRSTGELQNCFLPRCSRKMS